MILCLDYGSRYIGVAITDDEEHLSVRHSVIDQKKVTGLEEVKKICQTNPIKLILVGLPVSLSGKPSQQTLQTAEFIKQLRLVIPREVGIKTVDETLTSHEAERRLKVEGIDTNNAHAEAARMMLEEYLRSIQS